MIVKKADIQSIEHKLLSALTQLGEPNDQASEYVKNMMEQALEELQTILVQDLNEGQKKVTPNVAIVQIKEIDYVCGTVVVELLDGVIEDEVARLCGPGSEDRFMFSLQEVVTWSDVNINPGSIYKRTGSGKSYH